LLYLENINNLGNYGAIKKFYYLDNKRLIKLIRICPNEQLLKYTLHASPGP